MIKSNKSTSRIRLRIFVLLAGLPLVGVMVVVWSSGSGGRDLTPAGEQHPAAVRLPVEARGISRDDGTEAGGGLVRSLREPRGAAVEPVPTEAVLAVLSSGTLTMRERVRELKRMRGGRLTEGELEASLAFLAGQDLPENLNGSDLHWLADELLTVLRMQTPRWDDLAGELSDIAFLSGTDPVVRDYIMQHLGHLWEQDGARPEIDRALWHAVGSSDSMVPGTALIALSKGYGRDGQDARLAEVRERALSLAADPDGELAARVTALSIAADGGGGGFAALAAGLERDPDTPIILRAVAERVGK